MYQKTQLLLDFVASELLEAIQEPYRQLAFPAPLGPQPWGHSPSAVLQPDQKSQEKRSAHVPRSQRDLSGRYYLWRIGWDSSVARS